MVQQYGIILWLQRADEMMEMEGGERNSLSNSLAMFGLITISSRLQYD